jgi:hypothetical protein
VLFLLVILACTPVIAFQNEPDGFRNIKWGTNISELSGMSVVETHPDLKFYSKDGDKMAIGNASLDEIVYGFYKDQFSNVLIYFHSLSAFLALKDALFEQYGSGSQPNQFMERYYWMDLIGGTTTITLDFSKVSDKGTLSFQSKKLLKKQQADEKQKAKAAKGDL